MLEKNKFGIEAEKFLKNHFCEYIVEGELVFCKICGAIHNNLLRGDAL
jgi:hypothetical protein